MKRIGFGIVGSGHMGQTHAEAIRRLEDAATLVAFCGGSRAPKAAEHFRAGCESSVEALVNRPDIDAVSITTPPAQHFAETMAALEAGKHVLVEKPMATSIDQCDRMIARAAERGLVLAVAFNARFMATPRRARELINAGKIGEIRTIHYSMFYDGNDLTVRHKDGSRYAWYGLPENLGFLIDGLPHGFDLIRWLTKLEFTRVSGFCRSFLPEWPRVKDSAVGILELSNGAICSVHTTLAAPGAFPGEYFRISLVGSQGILDLDVVEDLHISNREEGWRLMATEPKQAITFGNTDSDSVLFGDARMQPHCRQMSAFIRGIQGAALEVGSGPDGRAALAPCLALMRSSDESRLIHLN